MPLSNLPGPWRWEERNGLWWRIHPDLDIEDGPHTWAELNTVGGHEFAALYYDREGKPIPFVVWGELFNDQEYKVVKQDVFVLGDQPVYVSTVWMGLNHNWMPGRPPKIFETMIFGGELDLEQWRYTTEEEALAGHAETCRLIDVIAAASATNGGNNDDTGSRGESD